MATREEIKNETKIKKAFARLLVSEDKVCQKGLRDLLNQAIKFALESHDEKHQKHIEVGDSYGWAIVHNGALVDLYIKTGEISASSVTEKLLAISHEVPQKGWIGILMATMHPFKYYIVSYEMGIMNKTEDWVKSNYETIFKKYSK